MGSLLVQGIAKSYGKRQILQNISLRVDAGKLVGLLGPNGSGKTTTFYILIGLIKADAGTIFLDERNITQMSMHNRASLGLGYLPQGNSVFRDLTVEENVRAAIEFRADLSAAARSKEVEHLLDKFSLQRVRDVKGRILSGGERRRTEIARLLATKPRFALLDEPFAGVDPISVREIKNLARGLTRLGIGVLINDHNVRDVLALCDENYVIGEGKIIAQGDAKTVTKNEQVRRTYLGEDYQL